MRMALTTPMMGQNFDGIVNAKEMGELKLSRHFAFPQIALSCVTVEKEDEVVVVAGWKGQDE